jgi:phospholipid/cholesterol/gamma-HCH transport system substrate-binding protein
MNSKRRLTWKELSMEFVAGLFFFAALAVLLVFTVVLSRENLFQRKHRWEVRFADVSGLSEGDNVLLHGVKVGRVRELTLEGDAQVRVALSLDHALILYQGCTLEIRYSSILGGRYVAITNGDPAAGELPPGTLLEGTTIPDLVTEATKFVQSLQRDWDRTAPKLTGFVDDMQVLSADLRAGKGTLGKLLTDDALHDDLRQTLTSVRGAADEINAVTADLRAGKGTLGKLVTDDTLYNDVQGLAADLRAGKGTLGRLLTEDTIYEDLRGVSADLHEISRKLAAGESTLGRLMMDDGELYLSLKNTLASAEDIAGSIRSGQGTLGKLVLDPSLYDDTRQTVLEVRGAVQDFREQTPVSTFGSLILGAF